MYCIGGQTSANSGKEISHFYGTHNFAKYYFGKKNLTEDQRNVLFVDLKMSKVVHRHQNYCEQLNMIIDITILKKRIIY